MTPTELRDRLDRAWDDEPPLPSVADRLADGHRALRRRRGAVAAVAGSAAAVVAAAAVLLPASGDGASHRGLDAVPGTSSAAPSSAPTSAPDAVDLVGITPDGHLDPRPGATVSRRSLAGIYDDERFRSNPEVGEVTYQGSRYYALVGRQSDGQDVVVVESAPAGRTLTQWVHDVDRRMRAGEDLG